MTGDYGWTGPQSAARKEELFSAILPLEWNMFSRVNEGSGQKASCQEMPRTFAIMRAAQALTWSVDVMESYLADLRKAAAEGRNIMTEKYARMMRLQGGSAEGLDELAEVPSGVAARIDRIVALSLEWKRETAERYPCLSERGRTIDASGDGGDSTSFETYLRGELETYSPRTISLYLDMVESAESAGVNLEEECLRNMVSAYGYETLDDAERALKEGNHADFSGGIL